MPATLSRQPRKGVAGMARSYKDSLFAGRMLVPEASDPI